MFQVPLRKLQEVGLNCLIHVIQATENFYKHRIRCLGNMQLELASIHYWFMKEISV